jgi:hypothetical protein
MLKDPFSLYKLDNFLNPETLFAVTNNQYVRRFPRLGNILAGYKRKLNENCLITSIMDKARNHPGKIDLSTMLSLIPSYLLKDENFSQEITFPSDEYYYVTWNIEKAKEIIKRDNIYPQKFECVFISQDINFNTVDQTKFSYALRNQEPIIIVDYNVVHNSTGGLIVIDGNHRLVSRTLQGVKYIEGYTLNREQQFEALADEFDICIYKIHSNIHYIMDYMMGRETSSKYTFFEDI